MNLRNSFGSGHYCVNGHVVVYAGSNIQIPDGTICSCGMTKTKTVKCPTCGHDHTTFEPIAFETAQNGQDSEQESAAMRSPQF